MTKICSSSSLHAFPYLSTSLKLQKIVYNIVSYSCCDTCETNSFVGVAFVMKTVFFLLLFEIIKALPSANWIFIKQIRIPFDDVFPCFFSLCLFSTSIWVHVVLFSLEKKIKFRHSFNHSNRKDNDVILFPTPTVFDLGSKTLLLSSFTCQVQALKLIRLFLLLFFCLYKRKTLFADSLVFVLNPCDFFPLLFLSGARLLVAFVWMIAELQSSVFSRCRRLCFDFNLNEKKIFVFSLLFQPAPLWYLKNFI